MLATTIPSVPFTIKAVMNRPDDSKVAANIAATIATATTANILPRR